MSSLFSPRHVLCLLQDARRSAGVILELARKDFRTRYVGSYLGVIWAFAQPAITILIMWFVFQVGFRSAPVEKFPFVLWLISAMIPWFFFSDSLHNATGSIVEQSYLVKKMVFRVSFLPLVKIVSALFVHLFFLVILLVVFAAYGYPPGLHSLQLLYYLMATIALVLGLAWITSSVVVFVRDMSQMVAIALQFCFWLTPIFWSFKMLPPALVFWFRLNPVYYLTEGYRNTLVFHRWFWEDPGLAAYFWGLTLVLWGVGAILFRRLRPHFADVL